MRICYSCGKRHPDEVLECQFDGEPLSEIVPNDEEELTFSGFMTGQTLGSYRLIRLLGEGGMGYVYLAEHIRLGRKVALKKLRSEFANSSRSIRRFFREARAVNQINHQNIVEITDFIEAQGGDNYYIMELLEGEDLSDLLARETRLSHQRVLGISVQICSALEAAHAEGIIHRDLKTENIFITERGGQKDFVKLLDFGIAKLMEEKNEQQLDKTGAGSILGTPEYMSPEQATGKEVDYRTDIYSLGIVLYEMVTGIKPFAAKSLAEIVIKQLTVKPIRPSKQKGLSIKISKSFENLILQCIDKEADKRPQSIKEVRERIEQISQQESLPLESFSSEIVISRKRTRVYAIAAAALLAILGLGTVLFVGKADKAALARKNTPVTEQPSEPIDGNPNTSNSKNVEVIFESTPQSAEVLVDGSEQVLGRTPLVLPYDRSSTLKKFVFRKPGYHLAKQEVSFLEDSRISVTLAKKLRLKKESQKTKSTPRQSFIRRIKKKKRRVQSKIKKRGTLNPFNE